MVTQQDSRTQFIADLRAFADLLERRPDMPLNSYPSLRVQYSSLDGTEEERRAEVLAAAARLGVDAVEDGRRITATLELGCVEYTVYAATDYGRAASSAENTYWGAIDPDMAGAR